LRFASRAVLHLGTDLCAGFLFFDVWMPQMPMPVQIDTLIFDCILEPPVVTLAIATRINPEPPKSFNHLPAELLSCIRMARSE